MAKRNRKPKYTDATVAFKAGDRKEAEALAWAHRRAQNPRLPEKPAGPAQICAGLCALADLLADSFDYEEAGTVLDEALTVDPSNVDGYALKVHLLIHANDLDGAEMAALAALECRPDEPLSHKLLIEVLFEKGRNGDVLDRLDVLETAIPTHPQARFLRAETLARLGRDKDAARAFAAVSEVAPILLQNS